MRKLQWRKLAGPSSYVGTAGVYVYEIGPGMRREHRLSFERPDGTNEKIDEYIDIGDAQEAADRHLARVIAAQCNPIDAPEPEKVAFTVTGSARAINPLLIALEDADDLPFDRIITIITNGPTPAARYRVREYETSIPHDETEPAFLCLRLDVIEAGS